MTIGFPLARNLATPCLGREPKARVATLLDIHRSKVQVDVKHLTNAIHIFDHGYVH